MKKWLCPMGLVAVCLAVGLFGCAAKDRVESCQTTADCSQFERCVEGYCTQIECQHSGECPAGRVCVDGFCTQNTPCESDADCSAPIPICDLDAGRCVSCLPRCSGLCCGTDGCGGTCADACSATGQTCDPGSCACEGDCQPNCQGRECGPDGCGRTCQPGCGPDETCTAAGLCRSNTCQSDADCPSGQICSGGTCAQQPTCTSDSQCEIGQLCVAGACVSGCNSNRDCQSGWTCLPSVGAHGTCAECQADGDCPAGKACQGYRCVVYCTSDGHCSPLYCDLASHQCVACTADEHCPEGEICQALTCLAGCRQDADCPSGHCNTSTHVCVQCVGSDDCPLGSLCVGQLCVAGCQGNRDCPVGLQCNPNLGEHGTCVECLTAGDCQPSYQCVVGLCEFHCQADLDCQPPRPACDPVGGVCVACVTNDHCAVGTICLAAACVPGCQSDRDCPVGSLCAPGLGENGACVACLVDGDCPPSYSCDAHQCIIQGSEMVRLPGGAFIRGSDPGEGEADEEPEKTILVPTFYIDRTEVTNDQYRACVQAGACTAPGDTAAYGDPSKGSHPVVYVKWQQASDFCAWMGKGLPSEARWERAARGTSDERTYPWGSSAPDCSRANYAGCAGQTRPVGSLPAGASPGGVLDMAGNVSEWVYDRYLDTYYTDASLEDPFGPLEGDYRVVRGGGYDSPAGNIRVANRAYRDPAVGHSEVGFRCSLRGSPTADFLVEPASGPYASTTFSVDAGVSTDPNHPVDVLEVRWDWEADDTYDTGWTTAKTASHRYAFHGVFRIRLELRDPDGNTDTDSFEVVAVGASGWDGATCASDQECAHGFRCVFDFSGWGYVCREACIWLLEPECHFGLQTCKLTIDPVGNACMP